MYQLPLVRWPLLIHLESIWFKDKLLKLQGEVGSLEGHLVVNLGPIGNSLSSSNPHSHNFVEGNFLNVVRKL